MSETLKFVTTQRDHLIDLSRNLIQGIEPRFFHQEGHRVTVLLNGAGKSGKSLFADVAFNELFSENKDDIEPFAGKHTSCSAEYDGQDMVFAFVNKHYFLLEKNLEDHGLDQMGGLQFIQKWDEDAWRQNGYGEPEVAIVVDCVRKSFAGDQAIFLNTQKIKIKEAYDAQVGDLSDHFIRFVQIKVNSEDILATKRFQDMWQSLSQKGKAIDGRYNKNIARLIS